MLNRYFRHESLFCGFSIPWLIFSPGSNLADINRAIAKHFVGSEWNLETLVSFHHASFGFDYK